MKRVVLGSALFLAAVLGLCILCAGAVASGYSVNGSTDFVDIWRIFGGDPLCHRAGGLRRLRPAAGCVGTAGRGPVRPRPRAAGEFGVLRLFRQRSIIKFNVLKNRRMRADKNRGFLWGDALFLRLSCMYGGVK